MPPGPLTVSGPRSRWSFGGKNFNYPERAGRYGPHTSGLALRRLDRGYEPSRPRKPYAAVSGPVAGLMRTPGRPDIKSERHYTASQLLVGGFDLRNTAQG